MGVYLGLGDPKGKANKEERLEMPKREEFGLRSTGRRWREIKGT